MPLSECSEPAVSHPISDYDAVTGWGTVLELKRRMAKVYPNGAPIKCFAQWHTYYSIDVITDHDLGFTKVKKFSTGPPLRPPVAPLNSANTVDGNANLGASSLLTISNKHQLTHLTQQHENERKWPRREDLLDRNWRYELPLPPPLWNCDMKSLLLQRHLHEDKPLKRPVIRTGAISLCF
ncbi:hypothetical protein DFH07DRAFT_779690 [Mycena maculata]|uniref:Uncharacterized protein n=1 Tax=Mycena maculata TaxID=230809 RepID=A0AAD7I825_9AGAR|nr:hypothetical protein DFH07DRAFT_779690 [Mycena maculata]